ncbi:MAG: hypothetical protein AB7K24_14435 [Gemmataceae bacterium]
MGARKRRLNISEILVWADAHHARTGQWPNTRSGPIHECPTESWHLVNNALTAGIRGLPKGSSLPKLLHEHRGVPHPQLGRELTTEQILDWADEHQRRTGSWPNAKSGPIAGVSENWGSIDMLLRAGNRGLPGGTTLARLLVERRGTRNLAALPPLTEKQILAWADAYRARVGKWPRSKSGPVPEAPGETWNSVERALRNARRGLKTGMSLAEFLSRHRRGKRYHLDLPRISPEQILAWADAHHQRTGQWPTVSSGRIPESPDLKWKTLNYHLKSGGRGLAGGSSLARFLARYRNKRNDRALPRLTPAQILAWAHSHRKRTGRWPTTTSGPVPESPGDNWAALNVMLQTGGRGLPGGGSLPRLLACPDGPPSSGGPRLTLTRIEDWMQTHRERTGAWPIWKSGEIPGTAGENWRAVEQALYYGQRGLPGRMTLRDLRDRLMRGKRQHRRPVWSEEQILSWADAYHVRHGKWPGVASGAIPEAPGENWHRVNTAFQRGLRGLSGGTTLARFLTRHRGLRPINQRPRLSLQQVIAWARAHQARTGKWPVKLSGPIEGTDETWAAVDAGLRTGSRGLPRGYSLFRLRKELQS